jgi:hypothetical protein
MSTILTIFIWAFLAFEIITLIFFTDMSQEKKDLLAYIEKLEKQAFESRVSTAEIQLVLDSQDLKIEAMHRLLSEAVYSRVNGQFVLRGDWWSEAEKVVRKMKN